MKYCQCSCGKLFRSGIGFAFHLETCKGKPMPDPWSYADKTGKEHAHQTALFMWANMARNFGPIIADDPHSYKVAGFAKTQFENAGKLGYKKYSAPIPQLKWLHAIHNQGHGDKVRGGIAKAEGVKAGVADMFLPVPMSIQKAFGGSPLPIGEFHGYYLELKVGYNKPDEKQLEFMADMRAAGYAADWAKGWLEARQKILDYLQIVVD